MLSFLCLVIGKIGQNHLSISIKDDINDNTTTDSLKARIKELDNTLNLLLKDRFILEDSLRQCEFIQVTQDSN